MRETWKCSVFLLGSIFSHCAKRPKGNTHKLLLTRKWCQQYCTPKLDGFVVRPCSFPENKTHPTKMNDKWNKSALQKVGDNSRPTGNTCNFFFTGGKFTVIVVKTWLNGAFQWPRKAELKVRHDITTKIPFVSWHGEMDVSVSISACLREPPPDSLRTKAQKQHIYTKTLRNTVSGTDTQCDATLTLMTDKMVQQILRPSHWPEVVTDLYREAS